VSTVTANEQPQGHENVKTYAVGAAFAVPLLTGKPSVRRTNAAFGRSQRGHGGGIGGNMAASFRSIELESPGEATAILRPLTHRRKQGSSLGQMRRL
jgi:hypothetical protein